ncbi:TonB-dependent siderophore receptor [Pseudoalteromonas fenneropenaei]|uniref:TonB-dependent siderophore receptor n=1 Tax=Pseudoalteromonas fenneropenaei TaxID=1737459 RepID=A0ABV7CJ19_9GAMM
MKNALPNLVSTAVITALASFCASSFAETNQDIEKITVTGKYTVNEVIDTATGLGLTLRETPQSVSVLTEKRIQDQALDTLVDAVLNAVGVSTKEIDNVRNTLQSRGFDINNYQIDGVPLSWSLAGDSGETIADVAIYERVEFVRGATGLLTGAGDPSASINLVRKHADSTELTGFVDLAIGSWNDRQITADVANALSADGSLRGRVVVKHEQSNSYTDLLSDKSSVLYVVAEKDLSPQTLLRVGASYQNNQPTSPTWGALPTFFSDGSKTDWPVEKTTAANWTQWETTGTNFFANINHTFGNGWMLVANYNKLTYEQDTELLYLFGTVDKTSGEGLSSWPYKSSGKSQQDSFDIQLKGQYSLLEREHDFVVGALYSEQSADTKTFAPLTNAFLPVGNFYEWNGVFPEPDWSNESTVAQDMDTEQKGFYAATRLNLTDSFKLIAGGRIASWQREGVSYDVTTDFGDNGVFIPYAGALYDLTEQHRVYASYTEIFQPQNAQDRNGKFLAPIKGKSYEIGLKSSYLDDRLHTTFALFEIQQDNLAQDDVGFIVPGTVNTIAQLAAEGANSKGFEFEVVGQPVDGWNIHLGYSQFKAQDAAGKEINTDNPRKQLKLFTTYQFIDLLPELTLGGGVNWQNDTYSATNIDPIVQDAYAVINLMASYEVTSNIKVQLNLDNLGNEKYYSQIGFFDQYRYGAPRNYSLSLNYRF